MTSRHATIGGAATMGSVSTLDASFLTPPVMAGASCAILSLTTEIQLTTFYRMRYGRARAAFRCSQCRADIAPLGPVRLICDAECACGRQPPLRWAAGR